MGTALAVALLAVGAALSAACTSKRGGWSGGGGAAASAAARAGALAATVDAALSGAALQLRCPETVSGTPRKTGGGRHQIAATPPRREWWWRHACHLSSCLDTHVSRYSFFYPIPFMT